jgi:transcriptional regulator with XRE-family HTH domain
LSQLALACDADISAKHLSFIETGRSLPSRDMVVRLAERLNVPPRERNLLLLAGGYGPAFPERLLADPALGVARKAIDLVLAGYEPYPAIAIDRHCAANNVLALLLAGIEPSLLRPRSTRCAWAPIRAAWRRDGGCPAPARRPRIILDVAWYGSCILLRSTRLVLMPAKEAVRTDKFRCNSSVRSFNSPDRPPNFRCLAA